LQYRIGSEQGLPFIESSRDLKMVACGPNYVVGLIVPERPKSLRGGSDILKHNFGNRASREQPRQEAVVPVFF
jgi:hypothetical protein